MAPQSTPQDLRAQFLVDFWQPYPAWLRSPTSNQNIFGGRITRLETHDSVKILHLSPGLGRTELAINISQSRWLNLAPPVVTAPPEPWQVLQVGDLVQICLNADTAHSLSCSASEPDTLTASSVAVTLLAPHLRAPLVPACDYTRYRLWQRFLAAIRAHFVAHGFDEIITPTLVVNPGNEPFLDPFSTALTMPGCTQTLYLPTSPELSLKKALAMGWRQIFEMRPCFRNGEWGPHHRPEFLMLEWYRAFSDLRAIEQDCRDLISATSQALGLVPPASWQRLSVQEALQKYVDPDFLLQPTTSRTELVQLAEKVGVAYRPDDSWDDLFFRIFLERIEHQLGEVSPTILFDYPPSQAALARLTPDGWADRFEIYWRGFELANAFHELNDPNEQRRRLELDNQQRRRLGKAPLPIDEEFLHALDCGLPPSGGIALGVERLFLALYHEQEIGRLRLFEQTAPETESGCRTASYLSSDKR